MSEDERTNEQMNEWKALEAICYLATYRRPMEKAAEGATALGQTFDWRASLFGDGKR